MIQERDKMVKEVKCKVIIGEGNKQITKTIIGKNYTDEEWAELKQKENKE